MSKMASYCAPTFEAFAIFEDSNLSQLGLPKEMITALHNKEEHYSEEYPIMGHTYKGGRIKPMPHQYFIPSPDIEITTPVKLRGYKTSKSPFQDKEVKSEYTDFAWYLQSLPTGPLRVFIVNKELNFFMFLYHKLPSSGDVNRPGGSTSGEQYAVMAWEPMKTAYEVGKPYMTLDEISKKFNLAISSILKENPEIKMMADNWVKKTKAKGVNNFELHKGEIVKLPPRTIDYGYSELTTNAADRALIRDVHKDKGGNTNAKIQEFVRAMTRQGDKKYAPSLKKPLYAYGLPVSQENEPRTTREARASARKETLSFDFLRVFADRFARLAAKARPDIQENLINQIDQELSSNNESPEIDALSSALGSDAGRTQTWLFKKFRDFRKGLFEEGRFGVEGADSAYSTTAGFELEKENTEAKRIGIYFMSRYPITKKRFNPGGVEFDPETGVRGAKAEQYKMDRPVAGEYASIPSIIKAHTLDGAIDKFIAFLVTGKIKTPNISSAGLLGIKFSEKEDEFKKSSTEDKESGNLLF